MVSPTSSQSRSPHPVVLLQITSSLVFLASTTTPALDVHAEPFRSPTARTPYFYPLPVQRLFSRVFAPFPLLSRHPSTPLYSSSYPWPHRVRFLSSPLISSAAKPSPRLPALPFQGPSTLSSRSPAHPPSDGVNVRRGLDDPDPLPQPWPGPAVLGSMELPKVGHRDPPQPQVVLAVAKVVDERVAQMN